MTTAAQHAVYAGVSVACALAVWPDRTRAAAAMREAVADLEHALAAIERGDAGAAPRDGRWLRGLLDALLLGAPLP